MQRAGRFQCDWQGVNLAARVNLASGGRDRSYRRICISSCKPQPDESAGNDSAPTTLPIGRRSLHILHLVTLNVSGNDIFA
jgi:hypothetical protein